MLCESHRPGIEPATCKSQVQRPATQPPRNNISHCSSCIFAVINSIRVKKIRSLLVFCLLLQEFEQEMKATKQELLAMKASKEEVEEEMNKLRSHYEEQLAVVDRSSTQQS